MNHRNAVKKIGKDYKHKKAILRNMALSILKHGQIKTTVVKGKIFRSFIEKIITRAKLDNIHNRRLVYRDIKDTILLKKLFENIAVKYKDRPGGYVRIIKLGQRKGDAAEMCYVSFVDNHMDVDVTSSTVSSENHQQSGEKQDAISTIESQKENKTADLKDTGDDLAVSQSDENLKNESAMLNSENLNIEEDSTTKAT